MVFGYEEFSSLAISFHCFLLLYWAWIHDIFALTCFTLQVKETNDLNTSLDGYLYKNHS